MDPSVAFKNPFYPYEEYQKLAHPSISLSYSHPMGKNRYRTIIPSEDTRVKLNTQEGVEHSDYINANYISSDLSQNDNKYIACQAPIDCTLNDFWRMVWEQRCGVIVMVTGLVEDNVIKATCYWPEEGKVKTFGNLLICHKKTFCIGEIIIRSLLIRPVNQEHQSTREIIQLHYEGWPDAGVPTTTKPVRDLLILMNKFQERASALYSLNGPLVVHCSAGVGRTGCLIACHIAIEKLKEREVPNIKQSVELMRKQRHPTTVRNVRQYEFIYTVVRDAVKDKNIFSGSNVSPMWHNNK